MKGIGKRVEERDGNRFLVKNIRQKVLRGSGIKTYHKTNVYLILSGGHYVGGYKRIFRDGQGIPRKVRSVSWYEESEPEGPKYFTVP